MILGTRRKRNHSVEIYTRLSLLKGRVSIYFQCQHHTVHFFSERTQNTFFSVKVRRVISVIRGRLLKEAAQSVSALTEAPGCGDFIRTIG